MYPRLLHAPAGDGQSFFLFGPRGTGKTIWFSSPWQKSPLHSTGVASRLTAFFVGRI